MHLTLEVYLPGDRTPDEIAGPEMHRMACLLEEAAGLLRRGCVTTHIDKANGAWTRGTLRRSKDGEEAWPIWIRRR